jgi:hypothetical protein
MRTLLGILAAVAGFALFLSVVWAGCGAFLKTNDAYRRGVEAALTDPVVRQALGAPVREGWFLNGTIEGDGSVSRGVWHVRLRGVDRSGALRIAAVERDDRWGVVDMSLRAADQTYRYQPRRGFAAVAPADAGPPDILAVPK